MVGFGVRARRIRISGVDWVPEYHVTAFSVVEMDPNVWPFRLPGPGKKV